jgi:hypothetical protein
MTVHFVTNTSFGYVIDRKIHFDEWVSELKKKNGSLL